MASVYKVAWITMITMYVENTIVLYVQDWQRFLTNLNIVKLNFSKINMFRLTDNFRQHADRDLNTY